MQTELKEEDEDELDATAEVKSLKITEPDEKLADKFPKPEVRKINLNNNIDNNQ